MRDEPTDIELLATARQAILEVLAPRLPAALGDEVARIVLAIDIAIRQRRGSDDWPRDIHAQLGRLYDGQPGGAAPQALFRRFAADLRRGVFDRPGQRREAAHAILRRLTTHKLAENNPDYPG